MGILRINNGMMFSKKFVSNLALYTGLIISAVAIYYSVSGLVHIFAAATIPIIIMGVALELGKLSATIWIKQNWNECPALLKGYLLIAIAGLMVITSMGIYGFLSKAHLDQAVPSSILVDKIAGIDEKIKIAEENLNAYKNSISQLDLALSRAMSLATTDKSAFKAISVRKSQTAERSQLQNGITTANAEITAWRLEKAPLTTALRKVEAEVGPIKYIAALLTDTSDPADLEKAVRSVIILIVIIFDPLAIALLLASQICSTNFISPIQPEQPAMQQKAKAGRKPRIKKVVTAAPKIEEVEKADISSLNDVAISTIADMPISGEETINSIDKNINANEIPSELDAISRPGDYILK